MSVGGSRIQVEEIGHGEFADAKLQSSPRHFLEPRKKTAVVFNFVFAESEDFVNHATPEIWLLAEERIAHDVEIRRPGHTESHAQGGAAGFLDIHQQLGGVIESHPGVERQHSRGSLFVARI
jgi:hypothetical protein